MEEAGLFKELMILLKNAGVEIRIEAFQSPPDRAGGLCRIKGKNLVLLHSGASPPERARALIEVVESLGLERLGVRGKDLSASLLSALNRRGHMRWPHKKDAPPLAKRRSPMTTGLHLVGAPRRLADLTTMGVGGPAASFREVVSESDVIDAVRDSIEDARAIYPLGGGSNVVVADEGVPGMVIKMANTGIDVVADGDRVQVTAGAGENWHDLAAQMTDEGLSGIECLGGIPGSVGATPLQNVGAYGQEVSQTIVRVRALERATLKVREFENQDCRFGYRSSRFKTNDKNAFVILSVTYSLRKGGLPQIRYGELSRALEGRAAPSLKEVFRTVIALRRDKSMVLDPEDENRRSCGSFFVNAQIEPDQVARIHEICGETPPTFPGEAGLLKVPSAWLIERAGLSKGMRRASVGLSTKHTLSIVAHAGARASDVIELATHVRQTVVEKFGIVLEPEPNFWGFSRIEAGLPVLPAKG